MPTAKLKQLDLSTGEVMDGFIAYVAPKRRNGFREGWVAMAQTPMEMLAAANLGAEDYRVLLALLARLDFENLLVVSQAEIASKLKMQPPNVNRSIKRLIALGVLLEGPRIGVHRSYRLNPSFGWKGRSSEHHKALKERMKQARIEGVVEGAMAASEAYRDPYTADMWERTPPTVPPMA